MQLRSGRTLTMAGQYNEREAGKSSRQGERYVPYNHNAHHHANPPQFPQGLNDNPADLHSIIQTLNDMSPQQIQEVQARLKGRSPAGPSSRGGTPSPPTSHAIHNSPRMLSRGPNHHVVRPDSPQAERPLYDIPSHPLYDISSHPLHTTPPLQPRPPSPAILYPPARTGLPQGRPAISRPPPNTPRSPHGHNSSLNQALLARLNRLEEQLARIPDPKGGPRCHHPGSP